jgi:DNA (cytosine-5)-methyltransferase 1
MRILSLFCGAGGMDLGFRKAGHEIVWANDNDPDCVETYRQNIGNHVILADVKTIEPKAIPDGDILIGGFPCQGFSMANLRRSGSDDRNELYREFLRRVKYKVLNAADYGVPQSRLRVIIIGTRKDLPSELEPQFPRPTHTKAQWIPVGKALKGVPDPDMRNNLPNHVYSRYKVKPRNFTGHRRTDPSKPSPTILARGNGKGGVCALPHPFQNRRLSVRESAIMQTFPLDFAFAGKLNSMYRQVGNAVPVLLAQRIAEEFSRIEKIKGRSR